MSVAELIERIKALPPDELEEVRSFVLGTEEVKAGEPEVRYASDEQFNRAADRVFENHDELLRKLAQ
ncbi:hypothetical protein BH20VER1_BH20VER1_16910 [soil metagenome]